MKFQTVFTAIVAAVLMECVSVAWAATPSESNSATFLPDIDRMKALDIRTVENLEIPLCAGTGGSASEYLCDSSATLELSNPQLDAAEKRLMQTSANRQSPSSVNAYNAIVSEYNRLALAQNEKIRARCLPLREYCEPVICQMKTPKSAWQKSTDTCVCSEGRKLKDGKCVRDSWLADSLLYGILLLLVLLSVKKISEPSY